MPFIDWVPNELCTSQNIRDLIDHGSYYLSIEAIQSRIALWMLSEAGIFWPAITKRTLGKKRLSELNRISMLMTDSQDKKVKLCGEYLHQILNTEEVKNANTQTD
jgi:hypothetical protein